MANDLLEGMEKETEETETGLQGAGALPEPPAKGPSTEEKQEEKTVFAPSFWERRAEAKASKEAGPKEPKASDTQARQAEKEARRQEKADEKEAKKLELKIAQEQRKAQEEERRRESKARDQERREQSRQREEEQRQRRREEKAAQGRVRRVGTMTLGVSLIAIGVAILLYMVYPAFDLRIVGYLAPIILISLGAEILIRYFFSKDKTYKYDFASGIICIFLVMGSFCVSLVPYLVYYISPERFVSEEQLMDAEYDKLYQAFQGDQRVETYHVSGGITSDLAAAYKDAEGKWIYKLGYLDTRVWLLDGCGSKEEFARTCRELLDKMLAHGVCADTGDNFNITFECPENEEGVSYTLGITNRLKLEMDAPTLAKLVNEIFSEPTMENGWIPIGYDDLMNAFGETYATHFAQLLEQEGSEAAANYYRLMMDGNYPTEMAESYYWSFMEDSDADDPTGDETPDEEETGGEDEGAPGEVPTDDGEEEQPLPPEADGAAESAA